MKKTDNRKYNVNADITGERFGKLVGVRIVGYSTTSRGPLVPQWLCKCDCGVDHVASIYALQRGKVTSCGCNRLLPRETGTTGHVTRSEESLYYIYAGMINNCYRDRHWHKTSDFVCPEWLGGNTHETRDYNVGYTAFKEWATRPVSEGGGGYNCAQRQRMKRIDPEGGLFLATACLYPCKAFAFQKLIMDFRCPCVGYL